MPRTLSLLLLAGLAVGCAGVDPPRVPASAVESTATSAPVTFLGAEPILGEISPGERHRYRLDVPPGRWVTVELVQREVALDLTLVDAAGTALAAACSTSNWSTGVVDLVTGDAGPFEVEIATPEAASRPGGYLLRLAEERPARADDAARLAARQRLRDVERPTPDAPALSAAEEETILRGLLESPEIAWSGEEAARIHELLGTLALDQNRIEEAEAAFRAGLDLLKSAEPPPVAARLRVRLGEALASRGLVAEAREEYRSGVEAARASGDSDVLGLATNLRAGFLYGHDEVEAAIRGLQEVVESLDPPHRVNAHLNLAVFMQQSGHLEAALAHQEAAERLSREAAVETSRFLMLRTGGTLLRTAGQVDAAVNLLREALHLALDEERTSWEMSIRIHLGVLLVQLGHYPEARRHLERSALLAEQGNDTDRHARALWSLAWVEMGEGDAAAAAELLDLALATPALQPDLETNIRYALAVAKIELGERAEAHELLETLAARAEAKGLQLSAADYHDALGSLHLAEGELDEAAAALGRAVELAATVGNPLRQAAVSSRLAELEVERGRSAAALEHVLEALRLQEAARSRLVEPDLRASFLARWRGDYERAIDISMRLAAAEPGAGHDRRAFALSEAAHARTLTELLAEARVVDLRQDLSEDLLAAEREADSRLTRLQDELAALFRESAPAERSERVRHELEQARHRRDEVERQIRLAHSEYADIRYPRPPGVDEVQAWLPPGTALLEYALGERSSALFVVTRDDLLALPLPPGAEIAALVAEVRRLLPMPAIFSRARLTASLAELTAILVAPAAERLEKVDRLLVVPDRDLFYLPFEALGHPQAPPDGPGGLLRRWTVTYLPSAAVLPHLGRETTSDWRLDFLAFADPPPVEPTPTDVLRGDAPSALVPADALPALPGARSEVKRIADLFPADRVDVHLGEAARESLLKSPQATAMARRLHIAAHGVIDKADPEASYVLLAPDESDDGELHLSEVFKLDLDAELVVLSGCETALGPRLVGEGLLGLTRGFLYAGARDLVVSLWPVVDAETEELMVDFYRRLEAGRSTAEALREAKLARLDGGQVDPFLWAPFVVFGAPAPEGRASVTLSSQSSPQKETLPGRSNETEDSTHTKSPEIRKLASSAVRP